MNRFVGKSKFFLLLLLICLVVSSFIVPTFCHVESEYIYSTLLNNKQKKFSVDIFSNENTVVLFNVTDDNIALNVVIDNPKNIDYTVECSIIDDSNVVNIEDTDFELSFDDNTFILLKNIEIPDDDSNEQEQENEPVSKDESMVKALVSFKHNDELLCSGEIIFIFDRVIKKEDYNDLRTCELVFVPQTEFDRNNNIDLYRSTPLIKIESDSDGFINLNGAAFKAKTSYFIEGDETTNYYLYNDCYIDVLNNVPLYIRLNNIDDYSFEDNDFSIQNTYIIQEDNFIEIINHPFKISDIKEGIIDDKTVIAKGNFDTKIPITRYGIASSDKVEIYRYTKNSDGNYIWVRNTSIGVFDSSNGTYVLDVKNKSKGCYKISVFYGNSDNIQYRVDKVFFVD